MKSTQVVFKDWTSGEEIGRWMTDWKFEKGQVFDGFWGAVSTVKSVELQMQQSRDWDKPNSPQELTIIQIVQVERKFYKF